jgi:hypothetical protein
VNPVPRNPWLVAGGWLSIAAALLHLACIPGGPDWYRFFGAGEPIARAAERGMWTPHLIAAAIAALLGVAAAYAFSGAGMIRRLPLLRTGLVVISIVYLLRGLVVLAPSAMSRPDLSAQFMLWSSLIVLVFGVVHAVGTWRMWPLLSRRSLDHHAVIS